MSILKLHQQGLFHVATADTLERVRHLNALGVPFGVYLHISPYAAKAGYLLSRSIGGVSHSRRYVTFFGNSRLEALDGAIKIVRHAARRRNRSSSGLVCVLDADESFVFRHDPLKSNAEDQVVPGICYLPSRDFDSLISNLRPVAVVCHARKHANQMDAILSRCRAIGAFTILDASAGRAMDFVSGVVERRADVVVSGENLTNYQVPFGAFSMAKRVYRTWNTFANCFVHTSTFGGNSLALSTVIDQLLIGLGEQPDIEDIQRLLQEIDDCQTTALRFFYRYVNPKGAILLSLVGADRRFIRARGNLISVKSHAKETRIIDALGNFGACLRGHNPPDIDKEVLASHDVTHDYWQDLVSELHEQTGYPHALPAVSGATAAEAAIIAALAANETRQKIVVFAGGFAGKTLTALIGTAKAHYRDPFRPLYRHVVYVDPFAANGVDQIKALVDAPDVALFWLESLQGEAGIRQIPRRVLEILRAGRELSPYLIGIDEIQSGMFRTGEMFHSASFLRPDIVTMGKGWSDTTFPIGITLLSDDVYQRAMQSHPELISHLESYYLNQLAAHISLHALLKAVEWKLGEHARAMGEILKQGLAQLERRSIIKCTRGTGLMQAIEFDSRLLGIQLPIFHQQLGAIVGGRCLRHRRRPVLTVYTMNNPRVVRIEPPLTVSRREIDSILATLNDALKGGYLGLLVSTLLHDIRRFAPFSRWLD